MRFIAIALLAILGWTDTASAMGWCGSGKLRVLLTNDDGYNAPGITAMRQALIAAGHDVTMVAPASNQSGTSAAVVFNVVNVTNPEAGVYAVAATPATSVLVGITSILTQRPNLIVSGINNGANIGPSTPISGTVGAVIAGIDLETPPVQGIAISTDLVSGSDPNDPTNVAHFDDVANFTARLIGQLITQSCASGTSLLPAGRVGLNVNYPPLAPADVKGVSVSVQGRIPYFTIGFTPIGGGLYAPTFGAGPGTPDVPNADTTNYQAGYVTVVPIDGDYTASGPRRNQVRQLLDGLTP